MDHDPVNHPAHYTFGKIEVIEIIEALDLPYHDGAALKYLLRWRRKGGIEDLRKAKWYIERMIENAETNLTVTVSRDPKEELSGSRGLGGEDRGTAKLDLSGLHHLPGPGEEREASEHPYVPDPRD